MAFKSREFSIDLERDSQTPWGIRLVGGSDLNTPLIITKVPQILTRFACNFLPRHTNKIKWSPHVRKKFM